MPYDRNSPLSPVFDDADRREVARRKRKYDTDKNPRCGDWVKMLDGTFKRIARYHGSVFQLSAAGSFYLSGPFVSYSGGLEYPLPATSLKPTEETKDAEFWIFHHNEAKGGNGVYFDIPVRVYELTP